MAAAKGNSTKRGRPAKAGHNGIDPKKAVSFVERVEDLNAQKASIMGKARNDCKVLTEDINQVLNEAKEAGIAKRAVKQNVKRRKLEKEIAACRENLGADEVDDYDQIHHALGDLAETPLGQAALPAKNEPAADESEAEEVVADAEDTADDDGFDEEDEFDEEDDDADDDLQDVEAVGTA